MVNPKKIKRLAPQILTDPKLEVAKYQRMRYALYKKIPSCLIEPIINDLTRDYDRLGELVASFDKKKPDIKV